MSHTLLGLLGRSGTGTVRGGGLLCQTSDASERPTWKTAGRQGEVGEGLSCVWRAGGGKGSLLPEKKRPVELCYLD